jgi:hypothetical protein
MGVKIKGGMYCDRCKQPVAAHKQTHPVRNTIGTVGLIGGGLGAFALKKEKWICPVCGGPTTLVSAVTASSPTVARAPGWKKGQRRCSKNGHLLGRQHLTCPIDGSPVLRVR